MGRGLGPQDPLSILLRLTAYQKDRLNLPPDLIAYAKEAAAKYGISEDLMLITLVQEQQWYQQHDPGLDGVLTKLGRFGDWVYREVKDPIKSLGIVHMKPGTARQIALDHDIRLADGTPLSSLSDTELTVAIEENPKLAIDLAAQHLADLRRPPDAGRNLPGADTDYGVFLLYSADTQQVRDYNEWLEDDPGPRSGDIGPRGEDFHAIQQQLLDTRSWEALTPEQREAALKEVGATMPHGSESKPFTLYPTAPGVPTTVTSTRPWDGTGEMPHAEELPPAPPPPTTPSPQPNKPPTPPS